MVNYYQYYNYTVKYKYMHHHVIGSYLWLKNSSETIHTMVTYYKVGR